MIHSWQGRPHRSATSRLCGTLLVLAAGTLTLSACGVPLIPTLEPSATPSTRSSATPTATPTTGPSTAPSTGPSSGPGPQPPQTTAPQPPSSPRPPKPAACTTDQLTFGLQSRPFDSGMSSFFWDLSVTNAGTQPCTVNGYPTVLLVSSGQPVGAASGLEPRAQPSLVRLDPGQSAFSLLHLTQAGAHVCPIVPVTELAVTPPNNDQSTRVATPSPIDGCNDATTQLVSTGAFAPTPVAF
ncbi:DUF4232 domain-containing protein [Cryobacterium arcticum]|uniref:DUF4232 domain-containing protein n=1 Tax=Cryobacterium arcticum TaxID=670052 RepID=A0A1B1BQ69_9MICO|nr:DUF4232 domain-containing protein [Cryobacterium arcticum]ANP74688.1 hypothetical protein PA27867_3773 [Cryobacterium arcticum]